MEKLKPPQVIRGWRRTAGSSLFQSLTCSSVNPDVQM